MEHQVLLAYQEMMVEMAILVFRVYLDVMVKRDSLAVMERMEFQADLVSRARWVTWVYLVNQV